jgi:isopentenyl-diphosphate Delta-isomerase
MSSPADVVELVLLDEDGLAVSISPKATVHHPDASVHLAFSCYLFDRHGWLLMTRRALHKPTWPGAWANSVCGHPATGEDIHDAVRQRARGEVGVRADGVRLLLPRFRYRAVMPDGVLENEMSPLLVATKADPPAADTDEVDEARWVDWAELRAGVLNGSREISPGCREQVEQLPEDPPPCLALPPALRGRR